MGLGAEAPWPMWVLLPRCPRRVPALWRSVGPSAVHPPPTHSSEQLPGEERLLCVDNHPSLPHQILIHPRECGPVPTGTGGGSSVLGPHKNADRQYSIVVKQAGSGRLPGLKFSSVSYCCVILGKLVNLRASQEWRKQWSVPCSVW